MAPLNHDNETALSKAVGIELAPVTQGISVKLPETALFEFGKSDVRGYAVAVLNPLAVPLERRKNLLWWKPDNIGTLEFDQRRSELRATAVGYAFVEAA